MRQEIQKEEISRKYRNCVTKGICCVNITNIIPNSLKTGTEDHPGPLDAGAILPPVEPLKTYFLPNQKEVISLLYEH